MRAADEREERLHRVAWAARNYMVEIARAPNNRDGTLIAKTWEQLVRALFALKPTDLHNPQLGPERE